ncbi:unnamed protein product [Spirodela intermedia]|uniref:Endonuclease/exonuclease/phosphatase domain-containing protein n=1 Tax=Spirodela intermedia TaxID=51605 RepID=A0A7I8LJI2_SPIIN|nr:unnamed protein product [Spirodela intermedia]
MPGYLGHRLSIRHRLVRGSRLRRLTGIYRLFLTTLVSAIKLLNLMDPRGLEVYGDLCGRISVLVLNSAVLHLGNPGKGHIRRSDLIRRGPGCRPLTSGRFWGRFLSRVLERGRFTVLSYNILADYLARDHWSKLYFHIPPEVLDWEWRKSRLFIEFGLWSPDIMCLQEVDRFQDLEKELALRGYNGVWKMRTGDAVDGCAVFWRACRFVLRHEEHIEFAKLGLRDNVAQICVLEVRTLLNQAYSVSKIWDDAPVIICGDFNCTPKSPLYNFISEQKLNLSGLARNTVSGQYSPIYYPPRTFNQELGMKSHHSDKGITDNALQGIEMDGSDNSTTCEEKYSPTETSVDMLQPGDIVTSEEREGADSSRNASSQGVALPSTVDFQYPCSSGETLRSILDQHLVTTSGNIEAKADTIDLLHEVNSSTTHARLKEEFTGIEMTKDASNSSNNIPSRVGDKDGLTPHGVDNSSDSIPDVVILNRTSCQWISKAITFSSESIAVSPVGLPSDLERTILDVSRHNSHEDKNLDSCLDFATEDLSAGHTTEKVENLSTLSVQVMAERVTSYTVLDVTEAGISDISDGNAALEASSCPIDEGEEGSSDPTFLEELHGPSNVQESMEVLSGASFSSQWMRRSYPDPFLWTPMEITAASGNPETTSLEHNLKLKSAYTEVEDYAGTKDSNGEPKVTSYNRQFMGTVDYIWHSEGLQTVRVLDTIPQNVLRRTCGFPTRWLVDGTRWTDYPWSLALVSLSLSLPVDHDITPPDLVTNLKSLIGPSLPDTGPQL